MPRKNRRPAISSIEFDGENAATVAGLIHKLIMDEVKGGVLTVNFGDGSSYDYENVPLRVFLAFEASGPSGEYFNAHIRGSY